MADLLRIACRPGWWWSHIPSGEYRSEKTGSLLKRMGLKPGMSDFLFVGPTGQHYWLELKRGRAPLTQAQQAFAEHLRKSPHAASVSLEDPSPFVAAAVTLVIATSIQTAMIGGYLACLVGALLISLPMFIIGGTYIYLRLKGENPPVPT